MFRKFRRFIGRVAAWLPVLWKDEDYDFHYLLQILQFKISRMRLHVNSHRIHGNWERDVKRMKLVENLLGRILAANYGEYEHKQLELRYGELVFIDGNVRHEMETPENKDEISRQAMKICQLAERQENQDYALVFHYIGKHIREWWC